MTRTDITKEELWHYLFDLERISGGSYGVVNKVDDDTCIKIYYKDVFDSFYSKDISKLDDEIDIRKKIENEMLQLYQNSREVHENEMKKLEYLSQIGLIKSILYYRDYKIAIMMKYYKDYVDLHDVVQGLDKKEIEIILKKIKSKLDEFIENHIYPSDISSSNILVNRETLDVVFIDLDDPYTRYESEEYFEEKPLVKQFLLNGCYDRYKQFENNYLN